MSSLIGKTAVVTGGSRGIGLAIARALINSSSLAGKNAFPEAAAYCASKSGLNAFSEALMQEVRHDGIRVAYVMPGSVNTNFGGHQTAGAEWKLSPDDVAEVVVDLLGHP